VPVPVTEKPAEPGAFACRIAEIRDRRDRALSAFLGSEAHTALLAGFGLGRDEMIARSDD
jgi:hypothetical protein